ncbi:hypothetical protein PsYK624_068440 [Phanerochaete sordida]|uniref:F-box domain-containing protein n=1 Tax=Phanerochaete sordida TaxID=48140 RepID=A0A9P3LCY9_9APHY|nr:hypothetical protein PsYK624_068440 [Phanerochaete sordida]
MPTEIMYEVFFHMQPAGLLALSRTSKALREFLLDGYNCHALWRGALDRVASLPPCPADISEPAYASLMFDTYCQICLHPKTKDNGVRVLFGLRMRLCKACCLADHESIHIFRGEAIFNLPDPTRLSDTLPRIATVSYAPFVFMTSKRNWEEFETRMAEIRAQPEDVRSSHLNTFREELLARRRACSSEAAAYHFWIEALRRAHIDELGEVRAQRLEELLLRLSALGLRADAEKILATQQPCHWAARLISVAALGRSIRLTDGFWKKRKDEIIEVINMFQCWERQKGYLTRAISFMCHLIRYAMEDAVLGEPLPPFDHMYRHPVVQQTILPAIHLGAEYFETPLPVNIRNDPRQFTQAQKALMAGIVSQWRRTFDEHLQGLAAPWLARLGCPASRAPVHPTAWYKCEACGEAGISYAAALWHRCVRPSVSYAGHTGAPAGDLVTVLALLRDTCRGVPDSRQEIAWFAFDAEAHVRAAAVLGCVWSIASLTTADVAAADLRVVCKSCMCAMTWRRAVNHRHAKVSEALFVVLDADTSRKVAELEKPQQKGKPALFCTSCREWEWQEWSTDLRGWTATLRHLRSHYKAFHYTISKAELREGFHYVRAIGSDVHEFKERDPLPVSLLAFKERWGYEPGLGTQQLYFNRSAEHPTTRQHLCTAYSMESERRLTAAEATDELAFNDFVQNLTLASPRIPVDVRFLDEDALGHTSRF